MTFKKLSSILMVIILLLICFISRIVCQKKLKMLMQQKEESDKIFEEKVAQDQKERAEKLASKYKPGKCFQTL